MENQLFPLSARTPGGKFINPGLAQEPNETICLCGFGRKRAVEHETNTSHPMFQKPNKTMRFSMFLVRAGRTWSAHGGRMTAPICPKTS